MYEQIHGPQALWSASDYLLANIFDLLAGANWQRGGGKGRKPQPFPRPKSAVEMRRVRRQMERMARKHAGWTARRKAQSG